MRVASLIVGLAATAVVFLQSCAGAIGGDLANDEDLGAGAGVGFLVFFLLLLGSALVLGWPLAAAILFGLATPLAWLGAATTPYDDLAVWGTVSALLTVFSFFGWRSKRRDRIRQQVASAAQSVVPTGVQAPWSGEPTVTCPRCGTQSSASVRFCPQCGLARA